MRFFFFVQNATRHCPRTHCVAASQVPPRALHRSAFAPDDEVTFGLRLSDDRGCWLVGL